MTAAVLKPSLTAEALPRQLFELMVKLWFVIAATGHWIFLVYILAEFFPPVFRHGLDALDGSHLPAGYVPGDTLGNLAALGHVLLAAVIIGGGPLQLLPAVRAKAPTFHRVLGRSYVVAAILSALFGLYMTWSRPAIGNVINQIGITGDGVLILVFAGLAIYHAIGRRIAVHRRWAMRLFMVASGVWFFRVGLMGWTMLTGGIGIDWATFTGPMVYTLGFAQYLLPLAMLQWYFRCQRPSGNGELLAFSGVLFGLTLFMTVGIFAATVGMWLPRMT